MKVLALVTDAFGGRGGIAQLNRDLLTAVCAHPSVTHVLAIPRVVADQPGSVPANLRFRADAAGGKLRYAGAVLAAVTRERFDLVICGHVNLAPLAWLAAKAVRAPMLLMTYGIEVWNPPAGVWRRGSARRADRVVSISTFTRERFLAWANVPRSRTSVLPCTIDNTRFSVGAPRADLIDRYQLAGRRVLLTVARLAGIERHKGIDEVLGVLQTLRTQVPSITYLVVGEGPDRARLQQKALDLGVSDLVRFAGYVAEQEKADHYRLADVFVMPGRGEGFGIVYLEAMACGIPVIASKADASRETVLDGQLGRIVDPGCGDEIVAAILGALEDGRGSVPDGLLHFGWEAFVARWHSVLDQAAPGRRSDSCPPKSARRADQATDSIAHQ